VCGQTEEMSRYLSRYRQTPGTEVNGPLRYTNPECSLPKSDFISCSDALSAYLRARMALETGKPRVIWTMTP
jgi:hypothetical protein